MAELAAIDSPLKAQFAEWAELLVEKAWPDTAVAVLVRLVSSADDVERRRLLEKAASIASAVVIDDDTKGGLIDPRETKARALLRVAPCLAEERRRDMLLEAWKLAPKGGAFMGVRTLDEMSSLLGQLSPQDLLGPWQESLTAASGHRAAVLQELAALPDVVHRLGGSMEIGRASCRERVYGLV